MAKLILMFTIFTYIYAQDTICSPYICQFMSYFHIHSGEFTPDSTEFCLVDTLEFRFSDLENIYYRCRNGWMRYENSCYLFEIDHMTWNEAMQHCKLFGAALAEVNTPDENHFLEQEIRKINRGGHYWLGAIDTEVEGTWMWMPSNKNFTFTDWSPGEPDNAARNEDCLEIYVDYHWNDYPCHIAQSFVCEQQLDDGADLVG